jgi:hypothetical protein
MKLTVELIGTGSDYLAEQSFGIRKPMVAEQHPTAESGGSADES